MEQLGRGAFGIVFRARQSDLAAREVVLKITAARSVEPQRLAKLQHTNIVPLYSMHVHAGMLAICMPYFGRQTLAQVLRGEPAAAEQARLTTVAAANAETVPHEQIHRGDGYQHPTTEAEQLVRTQPANVEWVVAIIAQLAEGLAHAHARNIIHSDLKPANVLLTDDGIPMLLDFNLATDSSSYQKETLLVGGTVPYMAPEHIDAINSGAPVHAASDTYSLGVIAFELLAGRRPFPDHVGDFEQTAHTLVSDRSKTVPWVSDFNSRVSAGLSSIVAHCLEPSLDRRYANAGQLAEDLRRYQHNLPLRYAPDRSLRERSVKWCRRNARGLRWSVAAVLLILLAALSAMYVSRQNRLADLEASTTFNDFQNEAHTAFLNLHAPGTEPALHSLGEASAKRALATFGLLDASGAASSLLSRLTPAQQGDVKAQGGELLYALASQTARERKVNDALRYNAVALTLVPPDASAKSLLEQRKSLLAANGDTEGAFLIAEKAEAAKPDEYDHFFRAMALLENHRYADAVTAWEKLCSQNRKDPLRWLLLGNAYVGAGRLTNGESCYTAVIALLPGAMNGYLYRGLCRADQGNFAAAEEDFTVALQINPSVPTTRINRALAYYSLGNFDAAERDVTAALEAGLKDPRAFFVRASIREAQGKYAEAKADRERGFSALPVDDKGWVARGIAALRDNPEQAAHEFEQGAQAFPNSKALLQNLVHVYGDRLGKIDEALRYAQRLVDLTPSDASALASQAVLYARKGDSASAAQSAAKAAENQPTALTSLQLACAYALLSKSQPEEQKQAIVHLKRALTTDPELRQRAAGDPDLSPLHESPEFKAILAAAAQLNESNPAPARSSPAKPNNSGREQQPEKLQQAS
jgi:serine/threonine protein kinase/predicted Zn-dependent protease